MQGVASVYFAYPVQEGLLDAAAIMACAAREAGMGRLVNIVMLQSSPHATTPRMRQNFLSEQVFDWAQVGAVHLRATVFHENVRALFSRPIETGGPVQMPSQSDTQLPLVWGGDVARVAVGLLRKDPLQAGTAVPVIGEVSMCATWLTRSVGCLAEKSPTRRSPTTDWRHGAIAAGFNQHAVDQSLGLMAVPPHSRCAPATGRRRRRRYDCRVGRSAAQELRGVRA